jgi:hypothetical protein
MASSGLQVNWKILTFPFLEHRTPASSNARCRPVLILTFLCGFLVAVRRSVLFNGPRIYGQDAIIRNSGTFEVKMGEYGSNSNQWTFNGTMCAQPDGFFAFRAHFLTRFLLQGENRQQRWCHLELRVWS